MDPKLLSPLIFGVVIVLLFYRRVRRSFGRQTVNTARLSIRAAVLGVVGVMLASVVWREYRLVEALAAGIVAGALLALVGLRHTRFEASEQGRFYTPHTYIGVLVLALFVGRLVYRLVQSSTGAPGLAGGAGTAANPLAVYEHSPLTLTIIGLPIGYYVLYNLGVLRKSRALAEQPPGTADA
jgi:drug/metabolite transporter superfamily protein YnfA